MSVYIGAAARNDYSAMRGPCPEGFHVPTYDDWDAMPNGSENLFQLYHLPPGFEFSSTSLRIVEHTSTSDYRICNRVSVQTSKSTAQVLRIYSGGGANHYPCPIVQANHIRPFKDIPAYPDNTWTKVYEEEDECEVYHNATLGLITIHYYSTDNGWIRKTMADKNLGATVLYNYGDTQSTANCGYIYQHGNNYGFDPQGTISTSSAVVDCTGYGPGNYYSNNLMRTSNWNQTNKNMWGGETGVSEDIAELKSAYIGEYINKESIVYKMNADSSGNLYVPIGGYAHSGYAGASYNWNISVDGGANTNYSGTGSSGGSITLSGYTAGTNHTIKITPTTEEYGWALAYGWYATAGATYLTEVVYDGSYMGYGESATSTGNYFRSSQYSGCTSLTTAPAEVLPDTVTSIGSNFRSAQYSGCTSLTTAAAEVLSGTVTTIGNYFRSYQCRGCTSLTTAPAEVLSGTVTTIGTYFRDAQYYGCTSLTAAAAEALPNTVTSIGKAFRNSQYSGCTSLTTVPEEVLPNSVASFGDGFRTSQYQGCISLTTISGWKDLSIGGNYYRQQQFYGCTASKTVKVLSDVGCASHNSNTLQNSYVTTVSVPSAYLSNFTGASVQPRSSITDSKFIGY